MYKLLLCLRYLRTRYIALASIVSVTLGVATMVVVNSVMAGFTTEMKDRIRGLLADVVIETHSLDGHADPDAMIARAKAAAPGLIAAATPTVEMYAVMSHDFAGGPVHRPVQLIGIDPRGKGEVGPLKDSLASYQPEVEDGEVVKAAARDLSEPLGWSLLPEARRHARHLAQVERYRNQLLAERAARHRGPDPDDPTGGGVIAANATAPAAGPGLDAPEFDAPEFDAPGFDAPGFDAAPFEPSDGGFAAGGAVTEFDPWAAVAGGGAGAFAAPGVRPGAAAEDDGVLPGRVYPGHQLVYYPMTDPETGEWEERNILPPGSPVTFTTVGSVANGQPESVSLHATVTDTFKSGMSEYDSRIVFCNIEALQAARGMVGPAVGPDGRAAPVAIGSEVERSFGELGETGQVLRFDGPDAVVRVGRWYEPGREERWPRADLTAVARRVTTIQIKLTDGTDPDVAVAALKRAFPAESFTVGTWEDKQGPLLAAVDVETTILNLLLFMIVAVAGFGILAIFYMIVVEKTRDIGILKALGAGSRGILTIFLGYGVSLGVVGAGAGCVLGLLFVAYINEIETGISWLTGRKVFDERIYYFPEIPTRVEPSTVVLVALGAVLIAVAASILPARRASRLHPVQALRFE